MRPIISVKLSKSQREAKRAAEAIRERRLERQAEIVDVLELVATGTTVDDARRYVSQIVDDRRAALESAENLASLAFQEKFGSADFVGKRLPGCENHEPATIIAAIVDIHKHGSDVLRQNIA